MADRKDQLRQFCRLIRARTEENRKAVEVLLNAELYGSAFGTLRQEIDSLIRISYIYNVSKSNSPARARVLIRNLVEGDRWTRTSKKGNQVNITDREMLNAHQRAIGWEKMIYEFGCQLIHLSRLHDYKTIDPVSMFTESQKVEIIGYLKNYHDFNETTLTFNGLIQQIPNVMNKICDNTLSITDDFESRLLNQF